MLSIVIPALNEEKFLPALLKSIRAQTFKDYEIIVADANSTDNTVKIAKEHGCRIVAGGLLSRGRNEGARAAAGDLLLFLDADTKLPSGDFIEKAINEFKERKLDVCSCSIKPMEKSKLFGERFVNFVFDIYNYFLICCENIFSHSPGSMILVKKSLHRKISGFNEKAGIGEDTLYVKNARKYGKFGILRSVKILWSIRRLEREKWWRPIFLWVLSDICLLYDEKKLEAFKRGFLQYHRAYCDEKESKKSRFDVKKIKKS